MFFLEAMFALRCFESNVVPAVAAWEYDSVHSWEETDEDFQTVKQHPLTNPHMAVTCPAYGPINVEIPDYVKDLVVPPGGYSAVTWTSPYATLDDDDPEVVPCSGGPVDVPQEKFWKDNLFWTFKHGNGVWHWDGNVYGATAIRERRKVWTEYRDAHLWDFEQAPGGEGGGGG